ncbi:hypothetical protein ES703_82250 [subsurface metagenome]
MKRKSGWTIFMILLIGLIFGAILGHILRDVVPILDEGLKVGFEQLTLNLYLFDISFSINLRITFAAIIGMLVSFLIADFIRR